MRKLWAILSTHRQRPEIVAGHLFLTLGDAMSRCAWNVNNLDIVRLRVPDDAAVVIEEGNPNRQPSVWQKLTFIVYGARPL